jgi:hypothetical protein
MSSEMVQAGRIRNYLNFWIKGQDIFLGFFEKAWRLSSAFLRFVELGNHGCDAFKMPACSSTQAIRAHSPTALI